MCAKLNEDSLWCLSFPTSCWQIDEKTCPLAGADIRKPSKLEKKTCMLRTNCDNNHDLPESQLVSQSHEIKQLMKPNQLS
jgi:hypothetical protein